MPILVLVKGQNEINVTSTHKSQQKQPNHPANGGTKILFSLCP